MHVLIGDPGRSDVAARHGQALPAASFWDEQESYERILGYAPRLLVVSFIAYLVGEFSNSFILAKMKIATNGRWLWMRTTGSTIVGQGLDSLVFILVAFWGTSPADSLATTFLNQWMFKTVYEALATPLTYVVVNHIKRQEGIDVFDTDISFNPVSLGD